MTVMGWCGLLVLSSPLSFKWFILDKFAAAQSGVSSIPYDDRSSVILCLGFFGGLGAFVGAWRTDPSEDHLLRPNNFFELPSEYKFCAGVGVAIGLLTGLALQAWFLGEMRDLGYEPTSGW